MATYHGVARLTDPDGGMIKPEVNVEFNNDRRHAPSYARSAPYFGQFWVHEGDLMVSSLHENPRCVLHLTMARRCTFASTPGIKAGLAHRSSEKTPSSGPRGSGNDDKIRWRGRK